MYRRFTCLALSVHRSLARCNSGGRYAGVILASVFPGTWNEVNRSNPQRTAFLASIVVLATFGAGGQTPPLQDPSVAQKPPMPLNAAEGVVHKGLFTIDISVTSGGRSPVRTLRRGISLFSITANRQRFAPSITLQRHPNRCRN